MGEEREDPQKLKRIVAAAYDYENDPKWADYWSNILIPPHVASRSDVVDHFKRKFYQRYVDPDLVVEALLSSTPSQSVKPSASLSTSSLAGNAGAQARNTGSTSRSSGASAASGSHTTSVRWDRQTIQFSVNAWVAAQYHTNFHVLAAIEAYVPCSGYCWLPPKCSGEDWEDS